jgi:hypothetical protein
MLPALGGTTEMLTLAGVAFWEVIVTVPLPETSEAVKVELALATEGVPWVTVVLGVVTVPRPEGVRENSTWVPSGTGAPLQSVTFAVMLAVPNVLTVAGTIVALIMEAGMPAQSTSSRTGALVMPPAEAVISVVPGATASANPEELIVATEGSDEFQVKVTLVTAAPVSSMAVAVKSWVPLIGISVETGVTVIEAIVTPAVPLPVPPVAAGATGTLTSGLSGQPVRPRNPSSMKTRNRFINASVISG